MKRDIAESYLADDYAKNMHSLHVTSARKRTTRKFLHMKLFEK
jgi:hypothetical protein